MRPLAALVIAFFVAACASTPRTPAPLNDGRLAEIPNIPNARYWGDAPPDDLEEILSEIITQRRAAGLSRNSTLALSGGADDGAYGAGLLAAWSDRGDRPEFMTVTGVSTGALSSPFAFLGADYDDDLKEVYGGYPPERIFRERSWIRILPEASAADSGPLLELIEFYADEEMIAEIAAEHRRGRRLLVQTTHLDAQRPVIWNLGAIAASGAPNAAEVLHKALLASASVPGAFPPVVFEVEVNGELFDELHADGGVVSESTVLAAWQPDIAARYRQEQAGAQAELYLVRNGRVAPEHQAIEYSLPGIAGRAVSTLIKQQGVSDLSRAYEVAQLRGADYYVTWIGEDFDAPYPGPFDPGYMSALYDYGYQKLMSGDAWEKEPPRL